MSIGFLVRAPVAAPRGGVIVFIRHRPLHALILSRSPSVSVSLSIAGRVCPVVASDVVTLHYLHAIQVTSPDQWQTLFGALHSQLETAGLGSVGDALAAPQQDARLDCIVTLRNLEYGRQLVDECLREQGILDLHPVVPNRWNDYGCIEYFADGWWNPDRYDPNDYSNCIHHYRRAYEDGEREFLIVGTSGCDGIHFGFRKRHRGLWAYYPLEKQFKHMADTIVQLSDGWRNGTMSV